MKDYAANLRKVLIEEVSLKIESDKRFVEAILTIPKKDIEYFHICLRNDMCC